MTVSVSGKLNRLHPHLSQIAGAICTSHVVQQTKGHPKKQLQERVVTTPRHWDRGGQHPPSRQSSSSHNLQTENWTLSTPLPLPQTKHFPFRQMSMWRKGPQIPQPHSAVLPHLRRSETPDMAQSGGCPQEAFKLK